MDVKIGLLCWGRVPELDN